MTVASQVKQTLASIKGANATIERYAQHHPDSVVKSEFDLAGNQLQDIIKDLEQRMSELEYEEPQFKGF